MLFLDRQHDKPERKLKATIENLEAENKNLLARIRELTNETKRLAGIISSKDTDCMVGTWCEDCDHVRRDKAITGGYMKISNLEYGLRYSTQPTVDGYVTYCAKHLHDLCPEHSHNSQEAKQ